MTLRSIARIHVSLILVLVSILVERTANAAPDAQSTPPRVKVATTTSLYDTGLCHVLEEAFEAQTGLELDIIYAGTGRALEWGGRGDVDIVATHSPTQEAAFIEAGHGLERVIFAYNHFLIAGPPDDPAKLAGMAPEDAFRALHRKASFAFVSRGDDSGTHTRERALWRAAGLDPTVVRNDGRWYVEAGLGMGPTLSMAAQLGAYTLTDIGTFLAYRNDLDLIAVVESGKPLLNVYALIACTRAANPDGAVKLLSFLTGPEGQALIGEFGRAEYGTLLFTPCADKECKESIAP